MSGVATAPSALSAPGLAPTPDGSPAAARETAAPPTNLTLRLTSFVGRVGERAKLAGLLAESRLVSVVGPGGAGKTRITVETGRERLPDYPGGVWFVELAPVHDPLDIPHAIVAALGRRDVGILGDLLETTTGKPRGRDALSRVVETLSRRPALLILDNCEHLVGATAEIADLLLGEIPDLHILTSTREPLGVLGETLYPLGPLALPPGNAGADEAMRYPAVRLFADRASAVRPGLAVDDANLAAVVEICRRLDGMPLAIELAAARTRALSPQQIATRLDDRFRLLTGGNRTAMPRHQTLRAVVEWSWDLLDDRERAVLRRLSVFAGGATLDAAEEVLPDGDVVHRDDVLDLLTGLVDKSLVDVFGTGEPRYRMLETIAAFAAEHRERAGETEATGARHLVWCKAMLDTVEPELRGRGQLAGLAAVGAEHDNIAAALRYAVDHTDTASALAIVARLGWYWQIRGYHREARTWMAEALALPYDEVTTDRANAEWFYGMTLAVSGREPESLRWLMRSRWHVRHFDPETMPPTLRLMRALTAALRDYHLGTFSAEELEPDPAYYNDPWTRGFHDLIRGHLAVNVGMTDAGLRWLRAARAQFAEIGERWGHSSAVAGLSEVYAYTGRLDDAIAAIGEGLGLVRELGAPEDMPMLLIRRSLLRVITGDRDGAQADVDEAAQVAADGETAGGMMLAYAGAADIARLMGDLAEAERLFAKALREMERSHNRPGQVSARMFLGIAYIADSKGDRTAARDALDRATVVALDTRDMPIIAGVAEGLAWWAQTEGDPEAAALLLGAAVTLRGHADLGHPDVVRVTREVRAALPPEVFDREFARGAALPPAEAEELMRRS
ncbi:MAG: AfsR/SARP family transcriptional regulator [Streptomycetaceae bacterium]|nr:AfsR/SARP family transcriptional regulator [Streptomycetaceae bacterium]